MEHDYSETFVAILCGGLGTRLGKLTGDTPKSLMDVNGRPFLYHQLDLIKKSGLTKVALCAHHHSDQIRDAAIEYLDLEICLIHDGFSSLGTGGAIKRAFEHLPEEMFVLYGDSYLPIDYRPIFDFHRASGLTATTSFWKGVDYGMSIYKKEAFSGFSGNFNIKDVQIKLRDSGQLSEWNAPERFYEIGSPQGLAEVRELLK